MSAEEVFWLKLRIRTQSTTIASLTAERDALRADRDRMREATAEWERFRKDLPDCLSEGIHTAFRKASSHPSADEAWRAIHAMPSREWGNIIAFVLDCLPVPHAALAPAPGGGA